jgi:prolyl-tRNA editing enzyme YbaK/EbsC (Cys-tRNA(Pro) deacylase)
LSGSSYNGVCPVGNPIKVPIIVSQKIVDLKPDFIWLGGGEVDLKLGFSMKEFIEKFNPYVADVAFDGYDFNIPMEGSEDMNE